ncbi:MAG: pilus assembly protein PilP [Proteobacteria bacterium]|nr:pilus assembly protein PilP [Pseudomonadota bacterium]MCP4915351.1 pilus assembly protein PilP [Pseudomonadota bacterium]
MLGTLLVGSIGFGLVACGDEEVVEEAAEDGEKKSGKKKRGKRGAEDDAEIEPLAMDAFVGDVDYAYNPIGKRDPFRSFFKTAGPESITSPTPLQRFEVDQYQLVGIVWGITSPRSMVQDPEGIGHVIEVGTYIGKNWGKVTQINSDSVVITEEYQTIDGELVTNQIVMELPFEDVEQ